MNVTAQASWFHGLLDAGCNDFGADRLVDELTQLIADNPALRALVPASVRKELRALFDKDICKYSMHACFDGVVGDHSSSNYDDFSKFNDLFQYVPSSQGWRNAMHYAQLI